MGPVSPRLACGRVNTAVAWGPAPCGSLSSGPQPTPGPRFPLRLPVSAAPWTRLIP